MQRHVLHIPFPRRRRPPPLLLAQPLQQRHQLPPDFPKQRPRHHRLQFLHHLPPHTSGHAIMSLGDITVDSLLSRITVTPGTRSGQPCIRDLRITVWDILKWLGAGASHAQILGDYPELTEEDILAALQWASNLK